MPITTAGSTSTNTSTGTSTGLSPQNQRVYENLVKSGNTYAAQNLLNQQKANQPSPSQPASVGQPSSYSPPTPAPGDVTPPKDLNIPIQYAQTGQTAAGQPISYIYVAPQFKQQFESQGIKSVEVGGRQVPIIYGQPPLGVSSVGGVLQNAPSSDYGSQSLLSQPSSAAPSGSSSINNNPPVNIKSYDELKAFESLQKAPLYKQVGILITNPITTISADIDLLRGNEKRFREKIGSEVLQANLISEESAKGNIIPALGKGASAALELLPISAGKGIGLGIRTIEKIPAIGKGIATIAKGGLISLAGYSIIEPITKGDTSEAIARGAYFGIALGTSGIRSTQNVLANVSGRTFIESGKDVGAKVLSESKSISMIQAKPNVLTSTESRYVGEVLKVGERNNLIEVGLKGGVESASKQITMLKSGQGSRKYLQTETTDIQPVETIIRMSPAELSRGASISRTPESVEFSEFAQFGKKTGASIAKTSKGEFMGAEETSGSVIRGR